LYSIFVIVIFIVLWNVHFVSYYVDTCPITAILFSRLFFIMTIRLQGQVKMVILLLRLRPFWLTEIEKYCINILDFTYQHVGNRTWVSFYGVTHRMEVKYMLWRFSLSFGSTHFDLCQRVYLILEWMLKMPALHCVIRAYCIP